MHNKILNNRIHRGTLLLQEYDFEIKYIKGKENVVAAALNRNEEVKNNDGRKLQIGLNILKGNVGIYSKQSILEDQSKMSAEQLNKCTKIDNLCIKRTREKELYFISEYLSNQIMMELHQEYGYAGALISEKIL